MMSRPTVKSWDMLKRVGRYLKGCPRLIWKYCWQAPLTIVDVTSDANWAGCRRGRKSTSGGTIMLGSHLIRSYSKTQSVIAKSSGESELYAVIRASTEGLGMITLLKDLGIKDAKVRIGMDASAAIGMAQRTGLNKVRHVEVDVLWIQEQLARRMLPIAKIPGPRNPSDLCTKNVGVALLEQYLGQMNLHFAEGRAAVAQKLHLLARRGLTSASSGVGDLATGLPAVIGDQTQGRVIAPPRGGDPAMGLLGAIGGSDPQRQQLERHGPPSAGGHNKKKKNPEERGVDSWASTGEGGVWRRIHRTPRRSLFTPHRVSGGPGPGIKLEGTRTTEGFYVASGRAFKVIDSYLKPDDAHKLMQHAWIGTTAFVEHKDIVGINSLSSLAAREWLPAAGSSSDRADSEPGQRTAVFESGGYRRIHSRCATRGSSKRTACGVAPGRSVANSGDYSFSLSNSRRHIPVASSPDVMGHRLRGSVRQAPDRHGYANHFLRRLYRRAYADRGETDKRNADAFWLKAISGNGKIGLFVFVARTAWARDAFRL